jgi:Bifunctional DNA primase/polymerase, N-terminal
MPQQTERVDHLRGALAYRSAGIPVFPLEPRTKVPLIPASIGGHGLHDATTDLDVIRAWWTRTPNANVGLRTGLVFDVVDLDSEDAVDALEEARDGREPLRGPLVATGKAFTTMCNSRAAAIEPASCPESTTEDEANMWLNHRPSIQMGTGIAWSIRSGTSLLEFLTG